jgi:hypothetical protein
VPLKSWPIERLPVKIERPVKIDTLITLLKMIMLGSITLVAQTVKMLAVLPLHLNGPLTLLRMNKRTMKNPLITLEKNRLERGPLALVREDRVAKS